MNVLVVGYGSIGARHARLLAECGCHTAVVSSRRLDLPLVFADLATALAAHRPQYVVIANATHLHHATLSTLWQLGYAGITLVEKPVFGTCQDVESAPESRIAVAYNLRFNPIIRQLRSRLAAERLLSVQAYVGQYLPDWRPATDYRSSYSASAVGGGGALRDLSHELDYLTWMLGGWTRVAALGGHVSSLEISSDDVFSLLLVTPACPIVTLQVNYLDRVGRRSIILNTDQHTFEADLIAGTLVTDGVREVFATERDDTYRAMHKAMLNGEEGVLCSLAEGLNTVKLIEAAEQAAIRNEWIVR